MLVDKFNHYFPEYNLTEAKGIQKLVRNPLGVNVGEIVEEIQEELIELQNDKNYKDVFESILKKQFHILKFG